MTDTEAGADMGAAEAQPLMNGADSGPGIRILAQFIRDLSFENPRAPESMRAGAAQPQIELGVEMNGKGRDDGLYEVDLKLSATAQRESEAVFHIELVYGGLFQIQGVPEADLEPVLLIECPRFLFPFARRIIADMSSEGGFPPLMLDPIDFASIYAARLAQAASSEPTAEFTIPA
jgi:preprotein translocase subunit SecB